MFDVAGYILVGGASRRMGADKAQLSFNGQTSLELIAAQLSKIGAPPALVGAHQDYRHLGLPVVPDVYGNWGALGGIHAALAACDKEWAAIVACDLPFITGELLAHLAGLRAETIDAVVPIQSDGRPQPLCALYRAGSCLPKAEDVISAGEHTPRALLARVRTRWVEFVEIADLAGANEFFLNINTPADFEMAKRLFKEIRP